MIQMPRDDQRRLALSFLNQYLNDEDFKSWLNGAKVVGRGDESGSLASGYTGKALFLMHASVVFNDELGIRRSGELLAKAAANFREQWPGCGLFTGVGGYAVVLNQYALLNSSKSKIVEKMLSDLATKVSTYLNELKLYDRFTTDQLDFVSGVSGMIHSIYCIKGHSEQYSECTDMDISIYKDIFTDKVSRSRLFLQNPSPWTTLGNLHPEGYLDIGVAHGVFGIINALGDVLQDKGCTDIPNQCLVGAKKYLQFYGNNSVAIEGKGPSPDQAVMIPTWCYGFLSKLISYYRLAKCLGNKSEQMWAANVIFRECGLEKTRKYLSLFESSKQYGLCHGAAGYILMLGLLVSEGFSRIQPSLDLSVSWMLEKIEQGNIGHIVSKDIDKKGSIDYTFLNGGMGIFLSLIYVLRLSTFSKYIPTIFYGED